MAVLFRNGLIVTMNSHREVIQGDLRVDEGKIVAIGPRLKPLAHDEIIEAKNHFVIPGLIQAHTHLCQALFRGFADDLKLLDWLKKRIWPMERFHNAESIRASARIGLLEMQLLGTTTILDMGTVRHTEDLFQEVQTSGMRYIGGKCLMDMKSTSGPLYEATEKSLRETTWLIERWHNKSDLFDYAICPRFVISCTEKLLRACGELQKEYDLCIHTHASESREEIALVKARTGKNNVDYIDHLGLLNPMTVIIHGVHLTQGELKKMVARGAPLVHCPSSNLKLASGIAPIERYVRSGLKVAIGSDGAPCNNTMDPFLEMRLTALLQKPQFGPEALPAMDALYLATMGGAKALCKDSQIGSLEVGKLADLVVVDRSHPSVATVENPYSALVYGCSGRDVRHVMTHGEWTVRDRQHFKWSTDQVTAAAREQRVKLFARAGINLSK